VHIDLTCLYNECKAEGQTKTPYYIHPSSGSFVAFAGRHDTWINPKGEELQTFTIPFSCCAMPRNLYTLPA
jgi:putative SOS response-associated peptidase YedK